MSRKESEATATRLPDAYAMFTPVFERMSASLVTVLRGLLDQFEVLVDDFSPPRAAPLGEFEGLGGVALRGDIGRVVQSELLLRTEAPIEFLRRLAEGETLYHETLYVDPGLKPIYRAVISTGPGSLGHGRFVALAGLFFLARMAAARNADFHWCFLPRTDGAVWFDELTVNNVKRLLRSASYREASDEDVADAHDLWSRLAKAAPANAAHPIDWVVGARPRPAGREDALRTGAHGMIFSVAAPAPGQPRAVAVGVRHFGRERKRALVTLPDDRVCVGALKTPFRPPPSQVSAGAPPPLATSRPASGWAPEYLMCGNSEMKLVRMADGLLLLRFDPAQDISQSVFIPLGANMRLAGVRLYREGFTIVTHQDAGGGERLTLGNYQLAKSGPPRRTMRQVATAPTAHLFKQQPAFALPSLCQIGGVRIHSTSGMPFQLAFGRGEDMSFQPLYQGPRILGSNGVHEVVRIPTKTGARIEVLRPTGYALRSFDEGDEPLTPPALRGVVYNHGSSCLAYSLAPNRWRFFHEPVSIGAKTRDDQDELVLKPYEALLAGRSSGAVVGGRVWSDARYGGEGEIRSVRAVEGGTQVRGQVIRLGPDAANVLAISTGDDGTPWVVTGDRAGVPDALVRYGKNKSSGGYQPIRFDLGPQRENARILDLEGAS